MVTWQVDNIKCGGCANRIQQKLQAIMGVRQVVVDVEAGSVQFEADESRFAQIEATLKRLGYPRSGSVSGLSAASAGVRSVVSCAIGRLSDQES